MICGFKVPTARSVFTSLLLFGFFNIGALEARADNLASVQQILSAFGGTCPSQGVWTQNAVAQSLSLAAVLDSIKNDPNCASLGAALQSLPVLANRVSQINARSLGIQINNLQNQEAGLLAALSTTSDPNMQYEIQTTLASVESSLTSYYQTSSGTATTAITEYNSLNEFTTTTQVALSQLAANQSCMLSHPNLAAGIASMAGSVASGMLTAGASLATAAGVSAVNALSEYVRVHNLQKEINNFVTPAALSAYECALESVTDAWCSAQDADLIISQKERYLAPPAGTGGSQDLWFGLTLLDQELPVLIGWLNEVRSGNDPTTQPEGDRQMTEFVRQGDVETAKAEALGIFNGGMPVFKQKMQESGDPKRFDAWTYERSLIDDFINKIGGGNQSMFSGGSSVPNPLFDIVASSCAPYQLIGLPRQYWPTSSISSCAPFDGFNPIDSWPVPGQVFVPNLDLVISNARNWINDADRTVSAELSQVLQGDARTIFQDAMIADQNGHSPYRAITRFMDFLSRQNDVGGYYSDTVARLGQIKSKIDAVIANGGDPDNTFSKAAVATVYQQAQLAYGPTLFQGRLQRAIRIALNNLVTSGSGVDAHTAAMLLASSDLASQLETISGTSSFATIKQDLNHAQERSEDTLRAFGDTFGKALAKGLENYDAMAARDQGNAKYHQSKASLCLMLMALPEWPNKVPLKDCLGEQLAPEIDGGPTSVKIDESTARLPHQQRACLYRDYLRYSDIYQNSLSNQRH